ncbi:hypothetical protein CMV_018921 [Castanea mollissima]|uniref:Uncharacterized protein n=1 Tax=Castanea mollissima TaxID=60419 RepID=A0A8J4VH89_9ROSI|nr:hypothetical protein CMV_018921 [Castanea mollissima]
MRTRSTREREPESLKLKMRSMVARHEQMKRAFTELKSQISIGLLEAEDVFASLAIPLMKLVGLKTMEMANEGRFTTIILNNHFHHHQNSNHHPVPTHDYNHEEIPVAAKAAMATGKQLLEKQQTQFVQLLNLLKQIESKVNSRRNNLAETIADHRASLRSFFQRAIANLSNTFRSSPRHADDAIETALKLLFLAFKNVDAVLGSVESGVEDLMDGLAEQMCDPMVEYAKGLRDDMKNGTCVRLLALVKEMERVIYDGRVQLEEAKNKQRAAEETKTEALNRLTESQQRVNKMKECLGLLSLPQPQSQHKNGSIQPVAAHKLLGKVEDQARDEKLLWELLERKRKNQAPESPMGPIELQFTEPSKKRKLMPLISHKPITRSLSKGQSPHTPHPDHWIPLGTSPSVAQQVSRRYIAH